MTDPVILFVCWGNICRSPMAQFVAQAWAKRTGVTATFTSAGVSAEEEGNPIDPRAAEVLSQAGFPAPEHRAHQVTKAEVADASLIVGMEQLHIDRLERMGADPTRTYLLSDFDPDAPPGFGIADPWYGPESGFVDTLRAIEAAMPELMRRAAELA